MVKNSSKYLHFWLEASGILLLHPLVSGYIFCSICHISETHFLRVYHGTQFSVSIFLDFSESDNIISWCLQGQQMWEQFFVFNFDCSTIYIKILHSFGNNCFAPSTDLYTLLVLFSVDIPSLSDFLLAMFELIVNYL